MQLSIVKCQKVIKLTVSEKLTLTKAYDLLSHLASVGVSATSCLVELDNINEDLLHDFGCEWLPVNEPPVTE